MLIGFAAAENLTIQGADVSNAYLNGTWTFYYHGATDELHPTDCYAWTCLQVAKVYLRHEASGAI